jgi:hypothetical protein
MKIIKLKNTDIDINKSLTNQLTIVNRDYILKDTEEDVTEYEYIELLYKNNGNIDYNLYKKIYSYLGLDFENQNDITKNKICETCAVNYDIIINYYITIMSMEDAQSLYLSNRSNDYKEFTKCCSSYINSTKYLKFLLMFLPIDQVELYLTDTFELTMKFKNIGTYGKKYGNITTGILDFIESYGEFENGGLKNYKTNPGYDITELSEELVDILYNGNLN